jgi:hypothetical protein
MRWISTERSGSDGSSAVSVLSETAGARGQTSFLDNGLIGSACTDG